MSETVADGPIEHLMLSEFVTRELDVIRAVAAEGRARWGQGAVVADGSRFVYMPTAALAAELADFPDLLGELLHRIQVCPPERGVVLVASQVAGGRAGDSWLFEIPLSAQ